jgi:hypothetical protein
MFFVRAKVLCMLLDLCKEFKIVIFVAVFHGVHSDYTILWIYTEEQHGPGGGVAEAAGVHVRHIGKGEPGPLPGRGVISTNRNIQKKENTRQAYEGL